MDNKCVHRFNHFDLLDFYCFNTNGQSSSKYNQRINFLITNSNFVNDRFSI